MSTRTYNPSGHFTSATCIACQAITLVIDHYQAKLPRITFFFEKVEKSLFCQMIFLGSQWMDFQNSNGI